MSAERIGKDVVIEGRRKWVGVSKERGYFTPSLMEQFKQKLAEERERRLKNYTNEELERIADELEKYAEKVRKRAKGERSLLEKLVEKSRETESERSGKAERAEEEQ